MGYSVPLANFARVFFALLSKFVLVDGELSEGSLAICPGLSKEPLDIQNVEPVLGSNSIKLIVSLRF